MTVKDMNKWLERVQGVINNTRNIQRGCENDPNLWENFAQQWDVNMSYKEFTYIVIEALYDYKNLVQDKIDNTEVNLLTK